MTIPQLKEWIEGLKIKKDEILMGEPLAIAIDRNYPEQNLL